MSTSVPARHARISDLVADWVRLAHENLSARRELLNALNIFPVPDADTGDNMVATMHAARDGLADAACGDPSPGDALTRAARAALMASRGNSGLLLASWLGGFAAGWSRAIRERTATDHRGLLAACLTTAADECAAAAQPAQPGTIVSVALAAAAAARADQGSTLGQSAAAIADAAWLAEGRTSVEIEHLTGVRRADSGGWGLAEVLEAFATTMSESVAAPRHRTGTLPTRQSVRADLLLASAAILAHESHRPDPPEVAGGQSRTAIEVVAVIAPYASTAYDELAAALAPLGDSLVITRMDDLLAVHVHVGPAGQAAVQGAIEHAGTVLRRTTENVWERT